MKNVINLRSLDALRGLLAVFVLAHHARFLLWIGFEHWTQSPHPTWQKALVYSTVPLRFGHEAVMVFFVLSGFFIHLRAAESMAREEILTVRVTGFFKRRAHRLVPPYLLALIVTIFLDAGGRYIYPPLYHATTGDAFIDDNFGRMGYSTRSVVPALLMLPDSLGRQFGSNGPLWSLAYEVVYYFIYPAWLCLRRRGWLLGYGVGGLGLAALALPLVHLGFLPVVLVHYPVWLAGAALAEVTQIEVPLPYLRWLFLPVVSVAALSMVVFQPPLLVLVAAYAAGGSAIVLWCALLPSSIATHPWHRMWEKIGSASYTIYIVHFPALALLCAVGMHYYGHRPTSGWPALGGVSIAAVFCGLCYWLCERHFLHRKLPAPLIRLSEPTHMEPPQKSGLTT